MTPPATAHAIDPRAAMLADGVLARVRWADPIDKARRDFTAFAQTIGLDREGKGLADDHLNAILDGAMIKCHAAGRHLSIVAPPGIRKSTRARLFALWQLGRDVNASIVFTSASLAVAESNVSFCRDIITRRGLGERISYRQIFHEVIPDDIRSTKRKDGGQRGWRQDKFFLVTQAQSADAAMEAVAVKTDAENRRVNILIPDDVMTRQIAYSAVKREALCSAFFGTWIDGRLSLGGWCCALQNCWHQADLAHRLLADPRFCSVWIGVREDCEALEIRITNPPPGFELTEHPERFGMTAAGNGIFHAPLPQAKGFTAEELRAKSRNPRTMFQNLYRLIAVTDADRMFPHWINRAAHPGTVAQMLGVGERAGLPVFEAHHRSRFAVAAGIDIAGEKRRGDVVTFWARGNGHIHPLEIHTGNFDIEGYFRILDDAWNRGIHFGVAMVENNGVQSKIRDGIRAIARGRNVPWLGRILPFATGSNKADPNIGLSAMDAELQTGYIVWPEGEARRTDAAHAEAWRLLEGHFAECPKILGSGETPDDLMASWFARRGLELISTAHVGELEAVAVTRGGEIVNGVGRYYPN